MTLALITVMVYHVTLLNSPMELILEFGGVLIHVAATSKPSPLSFTLIPLDKTLINQFASQVFREKRFTASRQALLHKESAEPPVPESTAKMQLL